VGPRAVWRDLCRCVRGAVAFWRYLRSQDTIDVALGWFEAASSAVMVGQPCRYVIRIGNVSEQAWDVNITLQISPMATADVSALPCASFTKHCTVPPRRVTEIACHYDWGPTMMFIVDTVASPPDASWTGEIKPLQRYLVSAILCDHTGKPLDQLDIYQELHG
jgi:hypothetical protein